MKMLWKLTKEAARYKGLYVLAILSTFALTLINLSAPKVLSAMTGVPIPGNLSGLREAEELHKDVIDKEILGIDLSDRETEFMKSNLIQLPVFCVLMLPYIFFGVVLFRNIIKNAQTKVDKCKYLCVALGAGTIIPDFLLKCDYGRWMFAIICYYCVVILALLAMKDKIVEQEFTSLTTSLSKKSPLSIVLLVYPVIFQPLYDVAICYVVANWAGKINDMFLHWW